jgi:glycosyltransferase involved in cell wall biosynthesis
MTDEPGNAAEIIESAVVVDRVPLSRMKRTVNPFSHLRFASSLRSEVAGLETLIERRSVDVVRVHGAQNPHGALAARRTRTPLVWVISSDVLPRAVSRAASAVVARYADSILLNGRTLMQDYTAFRRVPEKVFTYVPGVDVLRFRPAESAMRVTTRAELGISGYGPVVGTIANLNPQKDPLLFVDACGVVAESCPTASFVLVGGGSDRHEQLAARVRQRAWELLGPRLIMTGPRTDVERLIGAFDVMVVSSRYEGTTTTVGEALASGVPVVSTDVGAVREVFCEGRHGIVASERTPRSLADAILTLLKSLSKSMQEECRSYAITHVSAARSAEAQIAAYEAALTRSRRASR